LRLRQGPADGLGGSGGGEERTEVFGGRRPAGRAKGTEDRRNLFDAGQRQTPVLRTELPGFAGLGETARDEALVERRGQL
jgi:hypothetical protein